MQSHVHRVRHFDGKTLLPYDYEWLGLPSKLGSLGLIRTSPYHRLAEPYRSTVLFCPFGDFVKVVKSPEPGLDRQIGW